MTDREATKAVRSRLAEMRSCVNLPGDVPLPVCSSCLLAVRESAVCARCGRIFHSFCLEDGRICGECAKQHRADECSRETAGRLAVSIDSPEGGRIVFLFAQRTILAGRARRSQGLFPLPSELGGGKRGNDLVLRRTEEQDGELVVQEDESRLVSRCHMAFSIRHEGSREELFVHDVGTDGRGSTCGTWLRGTRIPSGGRGLLSDGDEIVAGRKGENEGVALNVRVRRSGERIGSVELRRRDALAERWLCVMVAGTVELGELCGLSGSVRVAGGRFLWTGSEAAERPLSPGDELKEGGCAVKVLEFDDALFWEGASKS